MKTLVDCHWTGLCQGYAFDRLCTDERHSGTIQVVAGGGQPTPGTFDHRKNIDEFFPNLQMGQSKRNINDRSSLN